MDQILQKYYDLTKDQSKIQDLYLNQLYILCAISHMLSQFVESWNNKFNQFKNLSNLYMETAESFVT